MKPTWRERLRTVCPHCGQAHDEVAELDGKEQAEPADGDLTLCFKCGQWAVFDARGEAGLRPPTDLEVLAIAGSRQCRAITEAWHRMMTERKGAP
jgi:thymidine kinase